MERLLFIWLMKSATNPHFGNSARKHNQICILGKKKKSLQLHYLCRERHRASDPKWIWQEYIGSGHMGKQQIDWDLWSKWVELYQPVLKNLAQVTQRIFLWVAPWTLFCTSKHQKHFISRSILYLFGSRCNFCNMLQEANQAWTYWRRGKNDANL